MGAWLLIGLGTFLVGYGRVALEKASLLRAGVQSPTGSTQATNQVSIDDQLAAHSEKVEKLTQLLFESERNQSRRLAEISAELSTIAYRVGGIESALEPKSEGILGLLTGKDFNTR